MDTLRKEIKKMIEEVKKNAWKDVFKNMPIIDKLKKWIKDVEQKVELLNVNSVRSNKKMAGKNKNESQNDEMIYEKGSQDENQ